MARSERRGTRLPMARSMRSARLEHADARHPPPPSGRRRRRARTADAEEEPGLHRSAASAPACAKPTRMSRWTPNISFSSAGSAWSKPSRCRMPCVVSSSSSSMSGCPAVSRLRLGDLRAQHDVAEQPGGRGLVLGARAQLVHREAQHVGRARLVHPLHVQLLHRALVDEHDRELGVGVHVHRVERVHREPLQGGLVDLDGRLVVDLDAHALPTLPAAGGRAARCRGARRGSRTRGPGRARIAAPACAGRTRCRRRRCGRRGCAARRRRS